MSKFLQFLADMAAFVLLAYCAYWLYFFCIPYRYYFHW